MSDSCWGVIGEVWALFFLVETAFGFQPGGILIQYPI
jgi:hypothetical protein